MAFCEHCGKPLHPGAEFCGACGAKVAQDDAGAASEQTAVLTPPAEVTSLEKAAGEAGAARGWRPPSILLKPAVLVVIALVVALAVVVAVVVLASSHGHAQRASDTFASQTTALLTPLVPIAQGLSSQLPKTAAACRWSTGLSGAVTSAQRLQQAVSQAQTACATLGTQNSSEVAEKQELERALAALGSYAGMIATLPARLASVSSSQAQSVRTEALAAQTALIHLHAVEPALPVLNVNSCTALSAGARQASRDAVLRLFLLKVQDAILNQSQNGRSDIVRAVGGVRGMTMNPDDAATMIESVQSNRQSLLDQLSAMNVPDDSRATRVFSLLQQSLQHSIEADRYFAAWMHQVYNYYYQWPQGYLGSVPYNGNYNSAVAQSSVASTAKSRFCAVYDPIARRLGLRSTWQTGQL